jgi:hypothetical protein
MKISLSEQIREAETHRDELTELASKRPTLTDRLHRAEGIILTLRLIETVEPEFRSFMAERSKDRA